MNNTLKDIIKTSREKLGISQRELARIVNVNNSVIARIEDGTTKKPNYPLLKKIGEELNIDMFELLNSANYSTYEIESLGYIDITGYVGIKGANRINEFYTEINDEKIIDLTKIFKAYKDNKINLEETFGLILCGTGIDLTKYVPTEIRKEHNLDEMIIEKNSI